MSAPIDLTKYGRQGVGAVPAYDPAMRSGEEAVRGTPSPVAVVRYRTVVSGHQYFIYRLPNWPLTRWAVGRMNRYLRKSGSSWKLGIKYRDPIAGQKYGYAGALKQEHAKRLSLYLRQRTVRRRVS